MWEFILVGCLFLCLLAYQRNQPAYRKCTIYLESTFPMKMAVTQKNPQFIFEEALTSGFWNSELYSLSDDFEYLDQQREIFWDEAERFFKEHQGWTVTYVGDRYLISDPNHPNTLLLLCSMEI